MERANFFFKTKKRGLRPGTLFFQEKGGKVVFPLIYLIFSWFFPATWNSVRLYVTLLACLVFFVPMIVTGKRYE
jgi:hypothetical protein